MSPVTHFLTGWVFANCAKLQRKDRAIVTLASVMPDVAKFYFQPRKCRNFPGWFS